MLKRLSPPFQLFSIRVLTYGVTLAQGRALKLGNSRLFLGLIQELSGGMEKGC